MSRIFIIVGYFVCIGLIACLLAYPIYLASGADFERIVSRSILVFAVLLFYPLVKLLNVSNFASLGFQTNAVSRVLVRSWLYGIIMLIPISGFFLFCGFRVWEPLADNLIDPLATILSAILSGLIIGLIEESLFRGLLQSQISQATHTAIAILIVSIIYSSVHFLQAPELDPTETIHWYSGFTLLFSAFANLGNIISYADSWIALFLAGVFLSLVRLNTNNVFWCIGLHAGWVTHIKIFKGFTDRDNSAPCGSLTGEYDKYIGELSAVWIAGLLICWLAYYLFKKATH